MTDEELADVEASGGEWANGTTVLLLVAEVRRLRALVKRAESSGSGEWAKKTNCPWCNYAVGDWKRRHSPECPAFTESGAVR